MGRPTRPTPGSVRMEYVGISVVAPTAEIRPRPEIQSHVGLKTLNNKKMTLLVLLNTKILAKWRQEVHGDFCFSISMPVFKLT